MGNVAGLPGDWSTIVELLSISLVFSLGLYILTFIFFSRNILYSLWQVSFLCKLFKLCPLATVLHDLSFLSITVWWTLTDFLDLLIQMDYRWSPTINSKKAGVINTLLISVFSLLQRLMTCSMYAMGWWVNVNSNIWISWDLFLLSDMFSSLRFG